MSILSAYNVILCNNRIGLWTSEGRGAGYAQQALPLSDLSQLSDAIMWQFLSLKPGTGMKKCNSLVLVPASLSKG
jgi:hypothetical protein